MSGLFGAIGRGLSAAGYAAGDMYAKGALMDQKSELDIKNASMLSEMELERAKRLAEFKAGLDEKGDARKMQLADDARKAQVTRIDAKAGEIADEQVGQKRGLIDAGISDRSTWTPEQQAAVDQSLGNDRKALASDTKTRTKAAVATGDISPKDAATLDQRSEADMTRLMLGDQRAQTMAQIAAGHDDTRKLVAGMMVASKKDSSNKEDRVVVHDFLRDFRREIDSNETMIRALRRDAAKEFDAEAKKELTSQIDELVSKNSNLSKARLAYAKDAGVKVPALLDEQPESKPTSLKPWEKYGKPTK